MKGQLSILPSRRFCPGRDCTARCGPGLCRCKPCACPACLRRQDKAAFQTIRPVVAFTAPARPLAAQPALFHDAQGALR